MFAPGKKLTPGEREKLAMLKDAIIIVALKLTVEICMSMCTSYVCSV